MKSCAAGFTEWLLFHIWKRNENTSCTCPYVLLPETVIYRLGKPFFWYYTDSSGQILRRAKSKVSHKYILEEFQGETNDLLAYYLGFSSLNKSKANSATIEFFTQTSLIDFIHNRDKCNTGILQRWVEPKSNQSSLIKVQWSQQFCLIERRTNKYKLDDLKVDFYEKLITYEGMEHNSVIEPVTAPWIIAEIQKICVHIAAHVTAVTGGNVTVTRMVLFFKQDKQDKLWLMYCSALKVMDLSVSEFDQPVEFQELEVTVPKHIVLKKLPLDTKGFEVRKNRTLCVGCNYLTRDSMMYEIPLNTVVEFFEKGKTLPNQGVSARDSSRDSENKSDQVPKVLIRLNKSVTNNKYEEMKKDPTWDHLQIKVCQDCFLHFTQVYSLPKTKPFKINITEQSHIQNPEPIIKKNISERNFPCNVKILPPIRAKIKTSEKIEKPSMVKAVSTKNFDKSFMNAPKSICVTRTSDKEQDRGFEKQMGSASKIAIPIYTRLHSKKNIMMSNANTTISKMNVDMNNRGDFIQDTLALLKNTINKLES